MEFSFIINRLNKNKTLYYVLACVKFSDKFLLNPKKLKGVWLEWHLLNKIII
jgi:hypothetical protein